MALDGVIYDLDGTLIDSKDDLADSVNAMLSRLGLPSATAGHPRVHRRRRRAPDPPVPRLPTSSLRGGRSHLAGGVRAAAWSRRRVSTRASPSVLGCPPRRARC